MGYQARRIRRCLALVRSEVLEIGRTGVLAKKVLRAQLVLTKAVRFFTWYVPLRGMLLAKVATAQTNSTKPIRHSPTLEQRACKSLPFILRTLYVTSLKTFSDCLLK